MIINLAFGWIICWKYELPLVSFSVNLSLLFTSWTCKKNLLQVDRYLRIRALRHTQIFCIGMSHLTSIKSHIVMSKTTVNRIKKFSTSMRLIIWFRYQGSFKIKGKFNKFVWAQLNDYITDCDSSIICEYYHSLLCMYMKFNVCCITYIICKWAVFCIKFKPGKLIQKKWVPFLLSLASVDYFMVCYAGICEQINSSILLKLH
jgi:hypothetical protein